MIYKKYHEMTKDERYKFLHRLENGEEIHGIKWNKEKGTLTIPYFSSIFHDPICQCNECNIYNQPERLSEKTSKEDAIV